MQRLIAFWNRDWINKLILIVASLLLFIVASIAFILLTSPPGGVVDRVYAQYFATNTPTITPTYTATPRPTLQPTITSLAPRTILSFATFTPGSGASPTPRFTQTNIASPTPVPPITDGAACIPPGEAETGTVIDVVDGNTVKVLIEDLVYTVDYIGIEVLAEAEPYGGLAAYTNGTLVFGKAVRLLKDDEYVTISGRLLRYVLVGDTFVNLELIQQGLAVAAPGDFNNSCDAVFTQAEQIARQAKAGQWSIQPPPTP